jgi:hypothetical protein
MLKFVPLRARLTFWFFCAHALIICLVALGSWVAMRVSLNHALDQGLTYRLMGLQSFIEANSAAGRDELAARLRELTGLGELFQVFDNGGLLVAQSEGLTRHNVGAQPPPDPGQDVRYRTEGTPGFPIRFGWKRILVQDRPLIIEVADPLRKFEGAINQFTSILWICIPIALAVATFTAYLLSGRALAPVDRIIDDARAIGPHDLCASAAWCFASAACSKPEQALNTGITCMASPLTRSPTPNR